MKKMNKGKKGKITVSFLLVAAIIVGLFQVGGNARSYALEANSQGSSTAESAQSGQTSTSDTGAQTGDAEEENSAEDQSSLSLDSSSTSKVAEVDAQADNGGTASTIGEPFTGDVKGVRFTTHDWGEAVSVNSGEPIYTTVSFSINNAEDTIQEDRVMFRATLPKGSQVEIAANKNYTVQKGDATQPEGTTVDADNDYFWFTWTSELSAATLETFSFTATVSANGITPSGQTAKVEVQMYDCDLDTGLPTKTIGKPASNTVTSVAPTFGWSDVAVSANATSFSSSGTAVPDLKLSYNATPKTATTGLVYTEKVHYESNYTLPMSSEATPEPYILLTSANLFAADGTTPLVENVDYKIVASQTIGGTKYITKFTLLTDIKNTTSPVTVELTPTSKAFMVKNAVFNTKSIEADGTISGQTTKFSIMGDSTNSSNTATPAYAVDTTGKTAQELGIKTVNIEYAYTNKTENGNETEKNSVFAKSIVKIGATNTSGTNPDLTAFAGDIVTYSIGSGWQNMQKNALQSVVFEDKVGTSDEGFDLSQIQPVRLTTGTYIKTDGTALETATLQIVITYSDSTPQQVINLTTDELKTSQAIDINSPAKVSSIQYKFSNMDSKAKVNEAPTVSYKVQLQTDINTANGQSFPNTASYYYEYLNPDKNNEYMKSDEVKSTTSFLYKAFPSGLDGKYSSNKTVENLNTQAYPTENDVLLYTIIVKNESENPFNLKNISDDFSPNLSVYNGTTVLNGKASTKAIDTKYLASNITNAVLWDPNDPSSVAADQSVLKDVTVTGQNLDFDLTGMVLAPGQTLKITYTMYTNSQFASGQTISNTFSLFNTSGEVVATGMCSWGNSAGGNKNKNKTIENVTPGVATTSAAVLPGDLVVFTATIKNDTDDDWNGPVLLEDNYSSNLSMDITGYSQDTLDSILANNGLSGTKPMYVTASSPSGNIAIDQDQITVKLGTTNNFTVSLGNIAVPKGESVNIKYIMRVTSDAKPNTYVSNSFIVTNNGTSVSQGYAELAVDSFAGVYGFAGVTKAVEGVEAGGVIPSTNNLVNGDEVLYTIDVANYYTRVQKEIHVKNFIDTIPQNVVLDQDSVKVYSVVVGDDGVFNRTEIDASQYTISAQTNETTGVTIFKVNLNSAYTLESALVNGNPNIAKNRLQIEYKAQIDTETHPIPASDTAAVRNNVAQAFFTEDSTQIAKKDVAPDNSGSGNVTYGAKDDIAANIDGDTETKSYIDSSAKVTIYNEKNVTLSFDKSVTEGAKVNASDPDNLSRSYSVDVSNYGLVSYTPSKIVDILPLFETLDETKPFEVVVTMPNDGEVTTYQAIYTIDPTEYLDSDGASHQRIIITGYTNGTETSLKIPSAEKNKDALSSMSPATIKINYSTKVDAEKVMENSKAKEIALYNLYNTVALYPATKDDSITFSGTAPQIQADIPGNSAYGSADLDGDPTTEKAYVKQAAVTLTTNTTVPFVNVRPQTATIQAGGSEKYAYYVQGTSTINPGDIVAWEVSLGNSYVANYQIQTITKGSKLVVTLPTGVDYKGFSLDSTGTEVVPDIFENSGIPEIITEADQTVLIWTLAKDYAASNKSAVTIRTATQTDVYATYLVDAYFVPAQTDDQYFYNDAVYKSTEYTSSVYSYSPEWKDLTSWLPETTGTSHFVESSRSVDVFGVLGVSSQFYETEISTNTTLNSGSANRVMNLTNRDSEVRYKMVVNNEKADQGITDLVMIDRLPYDSDVNVTDTKARESQAAVKLVGDGSFTVQVLDITTNAVDTTFTASDYVVEYFTGAANTSFTDADWAGTAAAGRWLSAGEVTDFSSVTAVRVRLVDYTVPKGKYVAASYTAKLDNYPLGGQIAYNSFGFNLKVGSIPLKAEPLKIGVKTDVNFDRVYVTKVLNDSSNPVPVDTFEFVLTGKNSAGVEVYNNTFTITADQQVGNTWVGSVDIVDLPANTEYTIVEKQEEYFEEPVVTKTITTHTDDTKDWNFTLENTPQEYNVNYYANNGVDVAIKHSDTNRAGTSVTILGDTDMAGIVRTDAAGDYNYIFTGWNTLPNGQGTAYAKGDVINPLVSTVNLYAQWDVEVTVTYDANGATGTQTDVNSPYHLNDSVTVLNQGTMAMSGSSFLGWNTKADGSGTRYKENQVFTITKNTVLYAEWGEFYTVTYDANGGTGTQTDPQSPYPEKDTVTVLSKANMEKGKYPFMGWNTKPDGSGTQYNPDDTFVITGNTVLYAQWGDLYTVKYDANGGAGVLVDNQSPYPQNGTVTVLDQGDIIRQNHEFLGWNTKVDGSGTQYSPNQTFVITSDMVFYAQWKDVTPRYMLTYDANTGSKAPDPQTNYLFNDVVTIASGKPVRAGYTFLSWNTKADGTGTSYKAGDTFRIHYDTVVYAQWKTGNAPKTGDETQIGAWLAILGGSILAISGLAAGGFSKKKKKSK